MDRKARAQISRSCPAIPPTHTCLETTHMHIQIHACTHTDPPGGHTYMHTQMQGDPLVASDSAEGRVGLPVHSLSQGALVGS